MPTDSSAAQCLRTWQQGTSKQYVQVQKHNRTSATSHWQRTRHPQIGCPTSPVIWLEGCLWWLPGVSVDEWMTQLPVPDALLQLIDHCNSCECKRNCSTRQCSCTRNNMPCTDINFVLAPRCVRTRCQTQALLFLTTVRATRLIRTMSECCLWYMLQEHCMASLSAGEIVTQFFSFSLDPKPQLLYNSRVQYW